MIAVAAWILLASGPLAQDPRPSTEVEQALADFQQRRYQEVISRLERVVRTAPLDAAVHHLLGLAYLQAGDTNKGFKNLGQSLELAPENRDFAINAAKAHLSQGQGSEAKAVLLAFSRRRQDAAICQMLGLLSLDEGKGEEAFKLFEKSSQLNPRDSVAWYYMGLTHHAYNHFEEAINCYQKSIQLKPEDAQAHLQLGKLYATVQRWENAAAELETAQKLDARSAETQRYLCETYLRLGSVDDALAAGAKAVVLAPDDASAQFQYGKALARAGRNKEAREHMRLKDSQGTESEPSLSQRWQKALKESKP